MKVVMEVITVACQEIRQTLCLLFHLLGNFNMTDMEVRVHPQGSTTTGLSDSQGPPKVQSGTAKQDRPGLAG